ncbi:hypothetical protein [Nocardiopsis salina]|uniref:hypothetical protein n=1 Tax=Nocardiopsis salina TaxID=245836 RepID=UPI00034A7219|nr:hypothetical protein [Nocardiopsis salina]
MSTTKTAEQYDPDHLQAEADKIERKYRAAREAAQKARAAVESARENTLTSYWQGRVTRFYDQVRPHVATMWEEFEKAATGGSEEDTLTAWRRFALARAQAHGEHEALRRAAHQRGLRGARPSLALQAGGYAECLTQVLTRFEEDHRRATTAQVRADADAVADAADAGTRKSGEVPDAPEIVARFKLGPSAVSRDSGAHTVKLSRPGDGRTVVFRDGVFYARDAETAELIRAHARRKSIREINEHGEEIDTFGDTFIPRP